MSHEPSGTLRQAASSTLRDAAEHLRGGLCADGAPEEEADELDRPEKEWAHLIQWAQARGLVLPATAAEGSRAGGREHDVRFDESANRWWKFTKLNSAGYTVSWHEDGTPYMHNATPLQYLERMLLQNEHLGDDVLLVGLCNPQKHDWRIVTTQPHVRGRERDLHELRDAFVRAGFQLLPWIGIGYETSLCFRKGIIDLWDIHPANVLITEDGLPLPFDVMITLNDHPLSRLICP